MRLVEKDSASKITLLKKEKEEIFAEIKNFIRDRKISYKEMDIAEEIRQIENLTFKNLTISKSLCDCQSFSNDTPSMPLTKEYIPKISISFPSEALKKKSYYIETQSTEQKKTATDTTKKTEKKSLEKANLESAKEDGKESVKKANPESAKEDGKESVGASSIAAETTSTEKSSASSEGASRDFLDVQEQNLSKDIGNIENLENSSALPLGTKSTDKFEALSENLYLKTFERKNS